MRKSEREVTNIADIADILGRCDTVRLGLFGEPYPYIVPVSFGYEVTDGRIAVYFHGAKEGLKHELIAKNSKVCIEADIFNGYKRVGAGVTTAYESVVGFGAAELADTPTAIHGLDLMMEHCGFTDFSSEQCVLLGITAVYRVTLDSVTGKVRTAGN
jgi:nitroimidazol reductase NimA-like FMN-containing flavoprotein (pyridoxamine 5'-phosphate oxidase superfamily)